VSIQYTLEQKLVIFISKTKEWPWSWQIFGGYTTFITWNKSYITQILWFVKGNWL